MTVYIFDGTMDGLLTAVFDAYDLKEQPEELLKSGDALPLFCDHTYQVTTDEEKAQRVWTGLEKKLEREALKLISVSWLSELRELNTPLFHYIYKVFQRGDISRNFADPDVLSVTNIARKVLHEQLRMKQFIRFQKAKDGTYLAVVSPDHNVLPIITDHFSGDGNVVHVDLSDSIANMISEANRTDKKEADAGRENTGNTTDFATEASAEMIEQRERELFELKVENGVLLITQITFRYDSQLKMVYNLSVNGYLLVE